MPPAFLPDDEVNSLATTGSDVHAAAPGRNFPTCQKKETGHPSETPEQRPDDRCHRRARTYGEDFFASGLTATADCYRLARSKTGMEDPSRNRPSGELARTPGFTETIGDSSETDGEKFADSN
jgi:hypothetical protein